jgi:hypothetical protein
MDEINCKLQYKTEPGIGVGGMQKKSTMNIAGLKYERWWIWPVLALQQQIPFTGHAELLNIKEVHT